MNLFDAIYGIIQTQGVVAGILLLKMWQDSKLNANLISKNCELQRFIMKCLAKELDEDHNHSNGSTVNSDEAEGREKVDPLNSYMGLV